MLRGQRVNRREVVPGLGDDEIVELSLENPGRPAIVSRIAAEKVGLEAIDALAERYLRAGKTLHLKHLSAECRTLLDKAGDLVEVNLVEDPTYRVADDRLA